jgi:hypothetical protein
MCSLRSDWHGWFATGNRSKCNIAVAAMRGDSSVLRCPNSYIFISLA